MSTILDDIVKRVTDGAFISIHTDPDKNLEEIRVIHPKNGHQYICYQISRRGIQLVKNKCNPKILEDNVCFCGYRPEQLTGVNVISFLKP